MSHLFLTLLRAIYVLFAFTMVLADEIVPIYFFADTHFPWVLSFNTYFNPDPGG